MGKVAAHPSLDAFAARVNADTITEQCKVIGEQREEIGRLRRQNRELLRERNAYADYVAELESAVIVFKGQNRTLASIWEAGEFMKLCVVCHDPDCIREHGDSR